MNEIRFNSFEPKKPIDGPLSESNNNQSNSKLFLVIRRILETLLLLIMIGAVIGAGVFLYKKYFFNRSSDTYSAVFLSNGQVYFGKIKENNSKEIILDDVFYLQSNNQGPISDQPIQSSQFTLIKLGNELHGPTDELFINKQNVLFYEHLRSDSHVVKSIKNYKL